MITFDANSKYDFNREAWAGGQLLATSPSDPCPTDLDRILTEGQDPDAQQYLVLGTVPIKGKKPGVLGAHAFIVLGTVPIK